VKREQNPGSAPEMWALWLAECQGRIAAPAAVEEGPAF